MTVPAPSRMDRRGRTAPPRGLARVARAAAAVLLASAPASSPGFALFGPCRTIGCFAGGEFSQPYNQEFRWSIPVVTVAVDDSFSDAWGVDGIAAVAAALGRWETAFTADPDAAPDRADEPSRETGILYDVESLVMHELGHALGLGHPDRAAQGGLNFAPDGSPRPATGHEVMFSALANATLVRELTADDIAGIRYLYDPANVNPGDGAGVGAIRFEFVDGSIASGVEGQGAHIDLFAGTSDDYPGLFPGGALGTSGISLHTADTRTDPGIVNGLNSWDEVAGGVDIFFNLGRPIEVLHPVPEPASAILALTALVVAARRVRSRR